jgi:hypothetical protein
MTTNNATITFNRANFAYSSECVTLLMIEVLHVYETLLSSGNETIAPQLEGLNELVLKRLENLVDNVLPEIEKMEDVECFKNACNDVNNSLYCISNHMARLSHEMRVVLNLEAANEQSEEEDVDVI